MLNDHCNPAVTCATRKALMLSLFILTLAISCKKDTPVYTRTGSVTTGTYTDMIRTIYDTIIIYNGYPAMLDLDMDHDGLADIRLISLIQGVASTGPLPRAEIRCLSGKVSLSGFSSPDTTFYLFTQSVYTGEDSIVYIDEYYRYACHPMSDHDSVFRITPDIFKISFKSNSETIGSGDVFRTDTLALTAEYFGGMPYTINKPDTVIRKYQWEYRNCNYCPPDQVCYIGTRIVDGTGTKYGWIKLSISGQYKITVFETAVQR